MLAELLSDGLINQRDYEILIKGLPFLKMVDGKLYIGKNMDDIDEYNQLNEEDKDDL